jgi:hypothetical protein
MARRFARVLLLVFQPLRPASELMAAVQLLVTIGGSALLVVLPFLSGHWDALKALAVAFGVLVVLSLRAAYQLQADGEALLGDTELRRVIAGYIAEGHQLYRRLKRTKRNEEVPRPLMDDIVSWGGRAIRDVNKLAPEAADGLYSAHGKGPHNRIPKDQMTYVKRFIDGLKKLGRELS